ncbi:stalk domain-containing protein [Cellulosilyticum sp. I15G10I2]|uniref:stalk domain-containing protein n=1 Tax=Cellulosilyticum sp. I15G10I2 TaxID=1892843 RepID=UPI00085C5B61|nr:stalk domain-containing protein [Cellulosilyticum sp. I15G10I2]
MQKNKVFLFIYLSCFLLLGFLSSSSVNASSQNIIIYLNNKPLVSQTAPFIEKGVTLVPMRLIFEALEAKVGWVAETQTVIAKKNATSITLTIGQKSAFIDINKQELRLPPILRNGTTYVPLRFISESLGANVTWDEKNKAVFIDSKPESLTNVSQLGASQISKALSIQEIGQMEKAIAFIYNHALDGTDSFGSGFSISEDGKIVTNYHVIANAENLTVSLDTDKEYTDITVLGYDVHKDIALLQINTPDKLPFCRLGDSDKVILGDSIVVIGNPMGLRNTLSTGIISSLKQQGFIQISAPISPGSSGGALFNMHGEVIGITSAAIFDGQNLGFCIPINEIKNISIASPLTLTELNKAENTLSAPQNVRAFPLSSSEIAVQWDYNPTIDYYYVYFCDNPSGKFVPFLDEYNTKRQFDWFEPYSMSNYDLPSGSTIYYQITAVKNGTESPFSQVVSATTLKDDTTGFIDIVKQGSFNQFPNQKVDVYFNAFFKNPKWTYFRSEQDENIVEFTGTYPYKNSENLVLIQFAVNPTFKSFEVVYLERDGYGLSSYALEDLVKAIFSQ